MTKSFKEMMNNIRNINVSYKTLISKPIFYVATDKKDTYNICSLPFSNEMLEFVGKCDPNNIENITNAYVIYGDAMIEIPIKVYLKEIKRQREYHREINTMSLDKLYSMYYASASDSMAYFNLLFYENPNPQNNGFLHEYLNYCRSIGAAREAKMYSNLYLNEKSTCNENGIQYEKK